MTRVERWSPGEYHVALAPDRPVVLVASAEPWELATALAPDVALAAEQERRKRLLERAPAAARTGPAAELVLAADAFVIARSRADSAPRPRCSTPRQPARAVTVPRRVRRVAARTSGCDPRAPSLVARRGGRARRET